MDLYFEDASFRFEIGLSSKRYDHKPTKDDYRQMKFVKTVLNPSVLLSKLVDGHSICHIFKNDIKKKKNFLYSYSVFIDVDDFSETMSDFLNACDLKPTLAYTTSSNGLPGKGFRFRLIYIFNDRITDETQYKNLYNILVDKIKLSQTKDHCGSVSNQLMNGNSNSNVETFLSNFIYDLHCEFFQNVSSQPLILKRPEVPPHPPIHNGSDDTFWKKDAVQTKIYELSPTDKQFVALLNKNTGLFLKKMSSLYAIITETHISYNEDGYGLFPEGYVKVPIRYAWKPMRVNPFHDHEKRRKRLFIDACIIKFIKSDISFPELLYNLAFRREKYYDNCDGVLTNNILVEKTSQVVAMNRDDILNYVRESEHGRFKIDRLYCLIKDLKPKSYAGVVKRKLHYEEIEKWYNPDISVTENLSNAESNGVRVSRSTLIRYCREHGLKTTPQLVPIETWYDNTMSVAENLRRAKANGIKVSKSKLYSYCKEWGINPKGTVK